MKEVKTTHTIDITPTPAETMRIIARMMDSEPGSVAHKWAQDEIYKYATLYQQAGLTWKQLEKALLDAGQETVK